MLASDPENIYCAVPGCTTEQKTNLNWYVIPGSVSFANESNNLIFNNKKLAWFEKLNIKDDGHHKDIFICPVHFSDENSQCDTPNAQNFKGTSSAAYTAPVEENLVIKKQIHQDKIQLNKTEDRIKQNSAIHCVVPNCPSGLKGYPSVKWYILPGFRRTKSTTNNSAYIREEETLYSKLNIPKVELCKSIQICSNHFHKTVSGSKELNSSPMSQIEDFEEKLQKKVIYKQAKPAPENIEAMKIHFNRKQLPVSDSLLVLSKTKGNDGKIHLKNWSDKFGTVNIQPFGDKLKQRKNFERKSMVTSKFPMQKTHILCKDLSDAVNNITASKRKILPKKVETVKPISNERPKNDRAVQLKYCTVEGDVYHITFDEGDHKIEKEFPDEPLPVTDDFEFVNVHDIINPTNIDKQTQEKQYFSKIQAENSEPYYHRKLNENQKQFNEMKDVGTQTYFADEFVDIIDLIRRQILSYKFRSKGGDFIINNCSLHFQPCDLKGRLPSILHVRRHEVCCSNMQLLEDLNKCEWPRTENYKSAERLSRVYSPSNGFHEDPKFKKNAIPNSHPDKVRRDQVKTHQNVTKNALVQREKVASPNPSKFSLVTFSPKEIQTGRTYPPKVKVMKSDDIKDEKLKRGLTNVLKNWRNVDRPSINFNTDPSNDEIQSQNRSVLRNNSTETKIDDVMEIPDEPIMCQLEEDRGAVRVEIKANSANAEEARKKIETEKDVSSLRRSDRKKKTMNFAAMIRPYGKNRGIKDLNRDVKLKNKRISNTETKTIGDINKKRKNVDKKTPTQSVNKKGKFDEIIGELEKFLELTLEEPSEDDASVLTFGDSFNCAYCLSPITPNSTEHEKCLEMLQKQGRLLDRIKENDGKENAKSQPKTNCPTLAAKSSVNDHENEALPIERDIEEIDKEPNSTRPKRTITKTTKNRFETLPKKEKGRRKKCGSWKIKIKDKGVILSARKSKSEPDEKKSTEEVDKLDRVEESDDTESESEPSDSLIPPTTICNRCNVSIDNRGLSNHSRCCTPRPYSRRANGTMRTICHRCQRSFDKRGLVSHLRSCTFCYCEHCDARFRNLGALKDHLLKLEDCFLCEKCEYIFLWSSLDDHQKLCKFIHKRRMSTVKELSYISSFAHRFCKLCSTSFESLRKFLKHVYQSHRNKELEMEIKTKCKILKKYKKLRMKVSEYKCKFCGKPSANMKEKVDHYEKCLERIVKKCAVKTELGTYIKAEVIM